MPHELLADTYLHQREYEKARVEAETALSKGKSRANPARLVVGQALIELGRDQEGVQALNKFLQESPKNPVADQVRALIADVGEHSSDSSAGSTSSRNAPAIDTLRAVPAPELPVKSWQPPGVDEINPPLVSGTVCPCPKLWRNPASG